MEETGRPPALDAPFSPFQPLFRNGHLQTIVGRYWPNRLDERRWPTTERFFDTEPDVRVLAHCNSQPNGVARATVLAVHGLTASSDAPYMRTLAQTALEADFDVIRLNVRNCGGTEHLAPTLYHSGLTADLRQVVAQLAPRPLFLAGFSMGGNMVMKLAGEWGGETPSHVKGVCGISAPICLATCARELGKAPNRIYEARFLRQLAQTLATKRRLMPERFSQVSSDGVRSIWEFDDRVTAPAFGFRDADDYYAQSSSRGFLGRIRVPALLLQAKDDPFIPFEIFQPPSFPANEYLCLRAVDHGGHVAFLARGAPRFWAIHEAVSFFQRLL
jgi:uncharacterized protein